MLEWPKRTASVSACLVDTMSPTSSRVIEPTESSSVLERDSGRMTVRAPVKSCWVSAGGCRRRWRGRLPAGPPPEPAPQVGADETRCTVGDFVEFEVLGRNVAQQNLQQRFAGGAVRQAQPSSRSHSSGARSRGSSASGVARWPPGDPGAATALRSSAENHGGDRFGRGSGSSASMSVTSSTPPPLMTVATASATARCRRVRPTRPCPGRRVRRACGPRTPPAPASPCQPGRSGDQHTQIRFGAKLFQQGRLVEGQLEPFGEPAGLNVLTLQVVGGHRRSLSGHTIGGLTSAAGAAPRLKNSRRHPS